MVGDPIHRALRTDEPCGPAPAIDHHRRAAGRFRQTVTLGSTRQSWVRARRRRRRRRVDRDGEQFDRPAMSSARPASLMAIVSMLCVQVGLAVAVNLLGDSASRRASRRLAWAALDRRTACDRGRRTRRRRSGHRRAGVVTSGTALFFRHRSPAFRSAPPARWSLGPLASPSCAVARACGLPVIAAVGVVLLTQPWTVEADALGVAFALDAAVCWATYIVLTQHVGDEVAGLKSTRGLDACAALVATIVAGPARSGG